jgi:hypothetical protein
MNEAHDHDHDGTCNCSFTPEWPPVATLEGRDWYALIVSGTASDEPGRRYGIDLYVRDLRHPNKARGGVTWSYGTVEEATAAAERHASEDLAEQRRRRR